MKTAPMIRLDDLVFSAEGKRIDYLYSVDRAYRRYFSERERLYVEYDVDVSRVPYSIAVVPFLANVMPIAWFLGMTVAVADVDQAFSESLDDVKRALAEDWKEIPLRGALEAAKVTPHAIAGERYAMLYSGGVDAVTTYLRHRDRDPDLVTVLGADIPVDDDRQWRDVTNFVDSQTLVAQNRKFRIKSNLRDFYTYEVDLLVGIGWWGKVQHGLALLGMNAPLSYVNGYKGIYFASSQADGFAWGSHPKIDDNVRWANVFCRNDGFELRRLQKTDFVVDWVRSHGTPVELRVCYSELNTGLNCGECEKCFRTILALVLAGADPKAYGFAVDGSVYRKIFAYFSAPPESTLNLVSLWRDIEEKAAAVKDFHVFEDRVLEGESIRRIGSGEITRALEACLTQDSKLSLLKFNVMHRFPAVYRLLRSLTKIIRQG